MKLEDAVLSVFATSSKPLDAADVLFDLESMDEMVGRVPSLATVFDTVRRLEKSGRLTAAAKDGQRTLYRIPASPASPSPTSGADPFWDSPPGRWNDGDFREEPYPDALAKPASEPAGGGVREALSHEANEWADLASTGFQWLKNIRDGVSTVEDAIANMEQGFKHCHEVHAALSSPASSSPAEAEALQAGVDAVRREVEEISLRAMSGLEIDAYGFISGEKGAALTIADDVVSSVIPKAALPSLIDEAAKDAALAFYKQAMDERYGQRAAFDGAIREYLRRASLSSAPAQEDGSKDLGAHPRGSSQNASGVEVTDEVIAQVADAIDRATVGYSMRLTKLVDEESTYTLTYEDGERHEFPDTDDCYAHIRQKKLRAQAVNVIEALSPLENSKTALADATNNPVPLTLSDAGSDAEGRA